MHHAPQTRIAALLVCGSVLWLLASHTPDMAHIKEDLQQAHDSVFDYLVRGLLRVHLPAATPFSHKAVQCSDHSRLVSCFKAQSITTFQHHAACSAPHD